MSEIHILAVISKLRPRVQRDLIIELEDIADDIAIQSGYDRGDTRRFADKLSQVMIRHLKLGDYVKLGDIGNFSVVSDTQQRVRISYRAPKELKMELANDFQGSFINKQYTSLDDEGLAMAWLGQHAEDIITMRDGSQRTASDYAI